MAENQSEKRGKDLVEKYCLFILTHHYKTICLVGLQTGHKYEQLFIKEKFKMTIWWWFERH